MVDTLGESIYFEELLDGFPIRFIMNSNVKDEILKVFLLNQ